MKLDIKTDAELCSAVGVSSRTEIRVGDKVTRAKVRSWLRHNGVCSNVVGNANYAELTGVAQDITDTVLTSWKSLTNIAELRSKSPLTPPAAPLPPKSTTPAEPEVEVIVEVDGTGTPTESYEKPKAKPAKSAPTGDPLRDAITGIVEDKLGDWTPEAAMDEDKVKDLVDVVVQPVKDRLSDMSADFTKVKDLADAIENDKSVSSRMPVISAVASGNKIMEQIAPFYKPGTESYINPLMLCSPPSFGKSHTIRQLGKSYDLYLEHGCSDDLDETSTMVGGPVPDGAGGFIVVDGILTEAVRAASSGKTVLLLLDEVLRLSPRTQEWLLTFLTGVKTGHGKVYRLRTRRVDDGRLEVIEAPFENLHIIAATNLGMISPVEAFWSRWTKIRIQWERDTAKAIGLSIMDSYGIGSAEPFAEHYADLIGKTREAVKDGRIKYPADFRLLEVAAGQCKEPTAPDLAKFIAEYLPDHACLWDCDLGDVVPESKAVVEDWCKALKSFA